MRTKRLYWEDDHKLVGTGTVIALEERSLALDQTCFYGGGGGQPPDRGTLTIEGLEVVVTNVESDSEGALWHCCSLMHPAWLGKAAIMRVDEARRTALSRYHTVLHLVNTIALRDYGAWITGAQIDTAYARIDFKWEGFSPSLCGDIEKKVNDEVLANRKIQAYWLIEPEFMARPALLRTLEVRPPVIDGRVRVVEIEGFDAQACGGTHVYTTIEIGFFSIERTENKGRINKRLYVRLNGSSRNGNISARRD